MSTSTQDRTRRTILLAAIRVLSANRSASMREIAEEADVARSTVHRYFADRPALEAAMSEFVDEEYIAIGTAARPEEGTGIDALERLATELFDHLEVFGWWFQLPEDEEEVAVEEDDHIVSRVVQRGHDDGTIDPSLPVGWVTGLVWSLLYSANAYTQEGSFTRGEVRKLFLHSLRKSVSA
ncbi:TetR/AcrR family transcriptional regulator [Aeromicrobium camelliae]|uniref:TetR/AcrR family transcriptional regulator n=1 Tax=Aeromicrobium camelliae TaxID=1538144 RepID=A0A3N6WP70_9ACTN|nr:TetR/AcrR family transcriptional regulator [Aeromicrobium camelliae]RQN09239.1 TetR/AcrR family transcriptional regulator [Aeromicrobium camelliae]